MKQILITGGAGLIGSNLSEKLLSLGYTVIVLDNFITSDPQNINGLKKNKNFFFIKHDIVKSLFFLNRRFPKISEIYHLACPTGVPNLTILAEEMLLTCSVGTRNVLEFAKDVKAKVIFTSSSEVYGDPQIFPQSEEYSGNVNPTGIRSPYEEGKRFSESLVMLYVRKYNVNGRIVRIFNTYGPGASDNETRVVSRFLRNAKSDMPILVEGDGTQTRTFCYVSDLVNALILISEKGEKGDIYNAGGDIEISIAGLAKIVLSVTSSKSPIQFIKRLAHDHQGRRPDLTKIKALGWRQTIDIVEGLNLTINK